MKKFLFAIVACLALVCTSCGVSRQAASNTNLNQTQVVLASANYRIIGQVSGESTQNYWFGFGGLSKKSMGESAISEMYKNADLKGAQAIINVNVCYKNKNIIVYSSAKAIATGLVIEFLE